jgi:hypothetical protein
MSIEVDIEGFKKLVAEFAKAAPTASIESLDNGFKCVGLAYLNIEPAPAPGSAEQIIAVSTFEWAGRRYHEREAQLIYGI